MTRKKKRGAKELAGGDAPVVSAGVPDAVEFCARLREHLAAELEKPCPKATNGSVTNFQALSEKLVQMAVGGSKDAIQIVLDRLAGKAQAAASNSDGGPVHVEYVIEIPRPDHDAPENPTPGEVRGVPQAS